MTSQFSERGFSVPVCQPPSGRRSIAGEPSSRASLTPGGMPLSVIENPQLTTPTLNRIEMFKNSNFSLIALMKQSGDTRSETMSQRGAGGGASQFSTPRLTPLKFLDRNRNQLVSQDELEDLESKIKALEQQISSAKKKGENKKLDKLEAKL